ncbi:hypothetical protein GCM10011348_18770 [Marinobacterium nitratireducens]|uniref:Haloacid dehalogenase, type II n=2 Tax=Marinobacterium nitratireducens TaxID=518897 RepID=A0A917ZDR0_9GAMM|nr:hypothetical protein GCM10011348_18770 [Marinobacterium nitratireducens]
MTTGVKTDFATLAKITLQALAARYKIKLSDVQVADVLGGFSSLPAHSDIKPALSKLREQGFRTVAFSNSSLGLIAEQIKNAGLNDYFSDIVSVEEAGTFKPSERAYQFVSAKLGKPSGQLRLVAAHDWDTHGALCAGLKAAYIDRSGAPYNPLYKKPEIFGNSMDEVVNQIISNDN